MLRLKPGQIRVQRPATCLATLGKSELENIAACIVVYHWDKKLDEWTPVSRAQIADWLSTSAYMQDAGRNPFWKIDIAGFIAGGWITGWDRPGREFATDPGMVTDKFIAAVSNPRVGKSALPEGTIVI